MYADRKILYEELEKEFDTKIISYVTGDRQDFETQIGQDVIDFFINHLDSIGPVKKISLFLYTRGGDTAAAWNIVNLLKMYCENFEVIIPHKAHSAGTIISLGADNIIMTKQATLGPIDPSLNTPLNPRFVTPTGDITYPVSVEAVKGYVEFAKNELNLTDGEVLSNVLNKLSDYVHPLVLGQVNRTRYQIKMLAEKLLKNNISNTEDREKIISFLCSDSGSHDYTINRREAKQDLKLNVTKPTEKQYEIIKKIYDDISRELGFHEVFNPSIINGAYSIKRGLIESISGGSDFFVTEGRCISVRMPTGQAAINNEITFVGWRSEGNNNSAEINIKGSSGVSYERSDEYGI